MRNCMFSPSGLNIIIYYLVAEMRSWIPVIYVILFDIKEVDIKNPVVVCFLTFVHL